jgi:hypothetical protein
MLQCLLASTSTGIVHGNCNKFPRALRRLRADIILCNADEHTSYNVSMTDQPVCPVHKVRMVSATHWSTVNGKPVPLPIHVCQTTDCLFVFDVHGFRELPETECIGQPLSVVLDRAKPRFKLTR